MIISEINIFNLGVYKGQHSINIKPKPGKPVILFGALNGAGKTTLLEGIQIALYGKAAKTNGRGWRNAYFVAYYEKLCFLWLLRFCCCIMI